MKKMSLKSILTTIAIVGTTAATVGFVLFGIGSSGTQVIKSINENPTVAQVATINQQLTIINGEVKSTGFTKTGGNVSANVNNAIKTIGDTLITIRDTEATSTHYYDISRSLKSIVKLEGNKIENILSNSITNNKALFIVGIVLFSSGMVSVIGSMGYLGYLKYYKNKINS